MKCRYCGQELPEGSAFCNYCGQPQQGPAQPNTQSTPAQSPASPATEAGTLKCPHCGSTKLQYTTSVKTQGVSVGDACCGYVCLGPIGLLCGLCGSGSSETKEYWVCHDCGAKFTAEEAKNAVEKKLQQEQELAKKQREKEAQLAAWHTMLDNCPYPPEQLKSLYMEAAKEEGEKDKQFRECCKEERKYIGAWQAAAYGMYAGLAILLIAAVLFLICLLAGAGWPLAILCGIIGIGVAGFFSKKDDEMFEMYASSSLRNKKQEKEQVAQHKAELKKYLEAYHGVKAEESESGRKNN